MKRILAIALIISATYFLKGSIKDPIEGPVDPTLSVRMQQSYIDSVYIDSAFAMGQVGDQQVRVRLDRSGDKLMASIINWRLGNGALTVQVYGKKDYPGGYGGVWEWHQQMTLAKDNFIQIEGPSSYANPKWFPRIVLKDAIGHEAIVGLRPEDPYVLLKKLQHAAVKFVVEGA